MIHSQLQKAVTMMSKKPIAAGIRQVVKTRFQECDKLRKTFGVLVAQGDTADKKESKKALTLFGKHEAKATEEIQQARLFMPQTAKAKAKASSCS